MTTTELLAKVRATRAQKGRMYDGELQALLADVAAHLEGDAAPDLLAALKETLRASPAGPHVKRAQAAIAKAEGR